MFAVAFDHSQVSTVGHELSPRVRQVAQVLEARNRVMASRELLYCSPAIRALVEDDIPLLIAMVR